MAIADVKTMPPRARWHTLELLGSDLRWAAVLGAIQAAIGLVAVARDTFLNNEGIFSYLLASMLADDPIPVLFLLKSRPPLALFYALPAALGFDAFAVVHVLVGSAAVPLTAVLARAAGQRWPNLAAAWVAVCPLAIASGASGVGNSDGTTLGVLAAVLMFAWDRPALAGVVAALLPLARAETVILSGALGLHALLAGARTRTHFFAGAAAPLALYALVGAVYHGDGIWFLHHPPHVTHSVPYSQVVGREQLFGGQPHQVTLTLLTLAPVIGLWPYLRPSRLAPAERTAAVFVVPYLVILGVVPALHPLNFGDMPRYFLPALPFLALLGSRAIEALSDADGPPRTAWIVGAGWLVAALGIAHVQDVYHRAPALLWAVAGWSLIVLASATPLRRAVPALAVALAAIAAVPLTGATRLPLTEDTVTMGRYLLEHVGPDTVVLTNDPELPMWVARHGGEDLVVHHMLAADQRYEIDTLANESVGQEEAMHALLRRHWYGPVVFAEEVRGMLRSGTVLALRDDPRTGHVLEESWLEGRSETTPLGEEIRIVWVIGP